MISISKLREKGVELKFYKKGQVIFFERSRASYFYQIQIGRVKMISFTEGGKEVIQNIFGAGDTFGEPPLMGDFLYPSRALSLSDCEIWRIPKLVFIDWLKHDMDLHFRLTRLISKKMEFKAHLLQKVSITGAKERILSFIDFLRNRASTPFPSKPYFIIPYTRQQLADTLALRVETVIRAVKELETGGEVKIIKGKICRPLKHLSKQVAV